LPSKPIKAGKYYKTTVKCINSLDNSPITHYERPQLHLTSNVVVGVSFKSVMKVLKYNLNKSVLKVQEHTWGLAEVVEYDPEQVRVKDVFHHSTEPSVSNKGAMQELKAYLALESAKHELDSIGTGKASLNSV
jgi:uncharacterized DUF497 family protein